MLRVKAGHNWKQAVWSDYSKFHFFGKKFEEFGNFWTYICYWPNFCCWKWPNIERESSHLVTLNWQAKMDGGRTTSNVGNCLFNIPSNCLMRKNSFSRPLLYILFVTNGQICSIQMNGKWSMTTSTTTMMTFSSNLY